MKNKLPKTILAATTIASCVAGLNLASASQPKVLNATATAEITKITSTAWGTTSDKKVTINIIDGQTIDAGDYVSIKSVNHNFAVPQNTKVYSDDGVEIGKIQGEPCAPLNYDLARLYTVNKGQVDVEAYVAEDLEYACEYKVVFNEKAQNRTGIIAKIENTSVYSDHPVVSSNGYETQIKTLVNNDVLVEKNVRVLPVKQEVNRFTSAELWVYDNNGRVESSRDTLFSHSNMSDFLKVGDKLVVELLDTNRGVSLYNEMVGYVATARSRTANFGSNTTASGVVLRENSSIKTRTISVSPTKIVYEVLEANGKHFVGSIGSGLLKLDDLSLLLDESGRNTKPVRFKTDVLGAGNITKLTSTVALTGNVRGSVASSWANRKQEPSKEQPKIEQPKEPKIEVKAPDTGFDGSSVGSAIFGGISMLATLTFVISKFGKLSKVKF